MRFPHVLFVALLTVLLSGCVSSVPNFPAPAGELKAPRSVADFQDAPDRPMASDHRSNESEDGTPLLRSLMPLVRTDRLLGSLGPGAHVPVYVSLIDRGQTDTVWLNLGPRGGGVEGETIGYYVLVDQPGQEVGEATYKARYRLDRPDAYAHDGHTWKVTNKMRGCDYGDGTQIIVDSLTPPASWYAFCVPGKDWYHPRPFLSPDGKSVLMLLRQADGSVGLIVVDLAKGGHSWSFAYQSKWGTDWDTFLPFFERANFKGFRFDQLFLLSYASTTGRAALDGITIAADKKTAEVKGLWTAQWAPNWQHFHRTNGAGRGLEYLAWNADSNRVVLDRFNADSLQFEGIAETTWEGPGEPVAEYSFPLFRPKDAGMGAFAYQTGPGNREIHVANFRPQ